MKNFMIPLLACTVLAISIAASLPETTPQSSPLPICTQNVISATTNESLMKQSADFFTSLLDSNSWPARWQCGTWSPFHGWLYISSDIIIWLSYFMIPTILGFFVYKKRKREPLPFQGVIFLFIIFILACGLTHLVDAAIFWWPAYRLSAMIRMVTALVSFGTVFSLVQIAPKVLDLKSPDALERMVAARTAELRELNVRLTEEIRQRRQAEERLIQLNNQLEEKSRGLAKTNEELVLREIELRTSDEKIRELNADLERKVEYRTKELDAINQELEAFTYSVSHDLRTPLRSIHGYTNILAEDYGDKLGEEGKNLLNTVIKSSRYMGQLIDDLLNFARTSRTKLVKENFNTLQQVENIVKDLLVLEKDRVIDLQIHSLEPCQADVSTFYQAWINLISNALKYTRNKEKSIIEIGCSKNDQEISYYVKDNGVGFDMAYSHKLFGVFQRLHRKEEFEGTGVGLALVKRIIERHGGKIWAEAKIGEGATFYFSLPLEIPLEQN